MTQLNCITTLANSDNGQPVWIDSQQSLFWVDDAHRRLYQYHEPSQELTYCEIDAPILSLSPRVDNGFIATLEDGIGFYDMQTRQVRYISKPEPFSNNYKTIAGITDNGGNYWSFTHHDNPESQQGNLYQLSKQMDMQRLSGDNWKCSAPPAFSKNGQKLYQSCKDNRYIYVTTLNEQGQPTETDSFCRISKSEGYPHGLCIDDEDCLWVSHRGIGVISRFNQQGERIEKIRIATPGIKYCTFGGEHLDTLFVVTSSQDERTQERRKIQFADAIISLKPGVSGLKVNRFAG
ncbi:MAG: SMP-30/gluconolactonase/LRE family protein [Cellvibrionaceae bacterium]